MHKSYSYQLPINVNNILLFLKSFKEDLLKEYSNIKYIKLTIILKHSDEMTEVQIVEDYKLNIKSKMREFLVTLNKNNRLLKLSFSQQDIFSKIEFKCEEISYAEYLSTSQIFIKKIKSREMIKKTTKTSSKSKSKL